MERMLVVIFGNEQKAYDGTAALKELDSKAIISVHTLAIVAKKNDGKIVIGKGLERFPTRALEGTAIGALIGLLGGPIGLLVGTATGTFAGALLNLNRAGVNAEFLDEVPNKLAPGKWSIVADISEEREIPVDARMIALGGEVFRANKESVEQEQNARNVAAIKANIAQLKAEQAESPADQKIRIQFRIDILNKRLSAKLEQAKQRARWEREEAEAKVDALEKKAAEAHSGEAKAKIKKRMAEIEKNFNESKENWDWLHEEPID